MFFLKVNIPIFSYKIQLKIRTSPSQAPESQYFEKFTTKKTVIDFLCDSQSITVEFFDLRIFSSGELLPANIYGYSSSTDTRSWGYRIPPEYPYSAYRCYGISIVLDPVTPPWKLYGGGRYLEFAHKSGLLKKP